MKPQVNTDKHRERLKNFLSSHFPVFFISALIGQADILKKPKSLLVGLQLTIIAPSGHTFSQ
jgi:hypothetical protein